MQSKPALFSLPDFGFPTGATVFLLLMGVVFLFLATTIPAESSTRPDDKQETIAEHGEFPATVGAIETINFPAISAGRATLQLFDAQGQSVTTLFDAPVLKDDACRVLLTGKQLPPGVYFYRFANGGLSGNRQDLSHRFLV